MYDMIAQIPDEHGTCRPVSICETPGFFNNGIGGHFKDGQEKEAEISLKEYYKEEIEKEEDGTRKEWLIESSKKPFTKYDAMQSVEIYFNEKPSEDIIKMIKKRAEVFTQGKSKRWLNKQRTMKILGFRLKKETTSCEEIEI